MISLFLATALAAPLPTPFTAAQIRDACPDGTTIVLRMTTPDEVGYRAFTFSGGTRGKVTIDSTFRDEAGVDLEAPDHERVRWAALARHASFDASEATRARDTVPTAWGELPAWRYDVARDGTTTAFWFADAMPGPPVRMVVTLPEGGQVVFEQTRRDPSPVPAPTEDPQLTTPQAGEPR